MFLLGVYHLHAESVSPRDFDAFANSLRYIRGIQTSSGEIYVGAVYDPKNPDSKAQAEQFVHCVGEAAAARRVSITARTVAVDRLTEASDLHMVYLATGLSEHCSLIYEHSRNHRIFPFSTSKAEVRLKCCILSFDTRSGVDIYLNQKTLRELGFAVDSAFKFMVKRI